MRSSSNSSNNNNRRRSKGTIVAYGEDEAGDVSMNDSHASIASAALTPATATANSAPAQPPHGGVDNNNSNNTLLCHHSARLALLCAQNAIRMGARSQLFLCPPGRPRRQLQAALRQRPKTISAAMTRRLAHSSNTHNNTTSSSSNSNVINSSGGGGGETTQVYFALEKLVGAETLLDYEAQEEALLLSTSIYDDESDEEEASSGDEDELLEINELFSMDAPPLDDDEKYLALREPLFVSADAAYVNSHGAPMSSMGPGAPGKLPFNRRKLRFFDTVSATDRAIARAYLTKEFRKSKMRAAVLFTQHLRKVQREAKRRKLEEAGASIPEDLMVERDASDGKAIQNSGLEPFQSTMSPAAAAALLIESLALNPYESIEGMAKCYDGIVAAGVAILDSQTIDPTQLPSEDDRHRPLRSEIIAALAPLLITSLEQPSGEVILQLAKLRRMAGTPRYQRRFVQRIAPFLIRPPHGAVWCLSHQKDMEAILAATELIFDSAFEVFSKGWYERGRLLLADNKRAKTLQSAAQQLRELSSEPSDGLALELHGHGHAVRIRSMAMTTSSGRKADGSSEAVLTEWEVIAVDRQIRASIGSVMSMDWSKTIMHADFRKSLPRRSNSTPIASSSTGSKRLAVVPHSSSMDSGPKIPSSPRSPHRSTGSKTPKSPTPLALSQSLGSTEGTIDVSSPSQIPPRGDRSLSPPPQRMPHSPPSVQRSNSQDDSKTPMTPPRSPILSPTVPNVDLTSSSTAATLSPKRNKLPLTPTSGFGAVPTPPGPTPSSPSASSVGTAGSDAHRHAPATPNPYTTSSSPAHYRMLTSTAAERKRTVAACRALRAQIQRFEDAFIQLHGRSPKGAAERAPLATTYAQYREWKRAIRADAACRIQALFRGARTRWRLLRLNDPKITSVILKHAGRVKGGDNGSLLNQLSLPVDIGNSSTQNQRGPGPPLPMVASSDPSTPPGQNLPWASKVVRRRSADRGDSMPTTGTAAAVSGGSPPPAPRPFSSPLTPLEARRARSLGSIGSDTTTDLDASNLPELQARKRDLKQQLKQYDMNFARRHGRMPVKAEKEPIRHLYESYNLLKSQITQLESDGRVPRESIMSMMYSPNKSPPLHAPLPPQRVSPTSGSESGNGSDESGAARVMPSLTASARSTRKLPVAGSPPISGSRPSPSASQDLAVLKTEKTQLHQMLRSYEKDFFKEHNRQVSSFADIKPVASQYRRYKEIKKAISALEGKG